MTIDQFQRAYAIARNGADLYSADTDSLYGFGLRSFQPVCVPIEDVAACIRWQCVQFNGGIDTDALSECHTHFVTLNKVSVLEHVGHCPHCGK